MEIRTLRYFLAVAREENMTRAAELLHVTQPTLSKQLKALEHELGKKLFIRHSFSIQLTDEGMFLRKRAEDLVAMADKMIEEFKCMDDITGGDIYFGLAESYQIRYLAQVIRKFKCTYPDMRYHITSGDTEQVTEKLDKGILDFAAIVEPPDLTKYHAIELPETDKWVAVVADDHPLARRSVITPADLIGQPLFCSDQSWEKDIPRWAKGTMEQLWQEGSFRLSYNGGIFAKEKLGILLTLEHLLDTSEGSGLTAIPLAPPLENKIYLIWRKHQVFSPIAQRFLEEMQQAL